ncbi:MAG: hypothetical protein IPM54_11980 [Polyangiaceae bacterium]|nr:hypothetical protein [Polyangiaceae bacterium]
MALVGTYFERSVGEEDPPRRFEDLPHVLLDNRFIEALYHGLGRVAATEVHALRAL